MRAYIKISDIPFRDLAEGHNTDIKVLVAFASDIASLPTIEIVRCKDCKHGEYRGDFDNYLCDQLGLGSVNDADFFCSYGERKDNE